MRPGSVWGTTESGGRTAVVVDPHPLWLDVVQNAIERMGHTVLGRASTPSEGLTLLAAHRPELLVLDVAMSDAKLTGLEFLRKATAQMPEMKAVVFTASTEEGLLENAFAEGAAAFVRKTVERADFMSAIRQVFAQSIHFAGAREAQRARPLDARDYGLTRRELEILQLVAEGLTNTQVARRLVVTEQTVKFHLSNIYRKLGAANRTEASRWAQVRGLLRRDRTEAS
jgi:DNA-binding NarL/FixJ family response regulator